MYSKHSAFQVSSFKFRVFERSEILPPLEGPVGDYGKTSGNEKLSSFFQGGVRQAQFEILFLVEKNAWREVVNILI